MLPSSSNTGMYPPVANLAAVLNSSNLSPLATNAFADPNAGYAQGLQVAAPINDNNAGHFNLVSGLMFAGTAASAALASIDKIQSTLNAIQNNVAILSDATASASTQADNRVQLQNNLKSLQDQIGSADIGGINLLDASQSDGIILDTQSGALSNAGKTPALNGSGTDQRFAFNPNKISFQTLDLQQAFQDLNNLQVQTFAGTDANQDSTNNQLTVQRFQNTLNQAKTALNGFKAGLADTAMQNLSVSFAPSQGTVNDGSDARQIAARLAQQLSNASFNITASPAIRFFSLFA